MPVQRPIHKTPREPPSLFMKLDTAEFHENLSIHFSLSDYRNILKTTLHEGLRAVLGVESFHSLRMRTLHHALDQHANSENHFYILNRMCRKWKSVLDIFYFLRIPAAVVQTRIQGTAYQMQPRC